MPLGSTASLLVVDDNQDIRETLADLLTEVGYRVHTAADGQEALERLQETVPDVLLLDLQMPRLEGWDVLRIVSAEPRWSRLPVIVISGVADGQQPANPQVCAWLVKPLRLDQLFQALRLILASPAASGQFAIAGGPRSPVTHEPASLGDVSGPAAS